MVFPPSKGNKSVSESQAALPGNDQGNPVSTGNGGIKKSLQVKAAGTKNAPGAGPNKDVNTF